MPQCRFRKLASTVAVLIVSFAALAQGADPVSPALPPPQFGYYPTQWKPFPGTWSEVRPIAVTVPTTPEPPFAEKVLPPTGNLVAPVRREKMILPLETENPPGSGGTTEPSSPILPSSPYGPLQPKNVLIREDSGPLVPIPDPFGSQPVVESGPTLGRPNTSGHDPVWSSAGTSEALKNHKAWLGAPAPVSESGVTGMPIIRGSSHELPTVSNVPRPHDPWRPASK